ncbi:MAG TPA: HAMP domain-containing sensor histidine kinase [Chloroflexaceae bacterium]|nr:HAMP domain-containing sensor histidine kinase [Chloroflexaceae bacterium]
MADQSARPDAEALYILALRLAPLLDAEEAARVCLEGCATLVGAEAGMLLAEDLPAAAVGIPAPSAEAARTIAAASAVRAATQMIGVSALPPAAAPLPAAALFAGCIPRKDAPPGVLILGRATPLDRAARLTLASAMPLVGQTLDRARAYADQAAAAPLGSRLVSRLAHDIRSPLVATHASLEVVQRLLRGREVPAPVFDALATGLRSIQAALELCNDMLEVSRLQHGFTIVPRPVPLERLVGETVEMLRPVAEQRGLALAGRVPPGLPYTLGDERLLRRMLTNLVSNAMRFAPPGGSVLVEALPGDEPDTALLRVSDDGPGIPPEERERIFLPFVQGPGEAGRGTGLGLALCREVAQAHGGRIWADGGDGGQGAVFSVLLPAAAPASAGR